MKSSRDDYIKYRIDRAWKTSENVKSPSEPEISQSKYYL